MSDERTCDEMKYLDDLPQNLPVNFQNFPEQSLRGQILVHGCIQLLFTLCIPCFSIPFLVQPCKLFNNKYIIASTQIANTGIFAFIAVLVFKLMTRKVLFINRKDYRNS